MSISSDRFAAEEVFQTFDPHRITSARVSVFHEQCADCGWEPEKGKTVKRCTKCGSVHFETFTLPGSILANADRT
ncbi:MAG: hypothetical protein AAGD32_03925 [Planctomycetota bacterium]